MACVKYILPFLNLATTFLGILLTVGYVDLMIRDHETRRWAGAQSRINQRLESLANVAWTQFRVAFEYSLDIINEDAVQSKDPVARRMEFIRVAENIIIPSARSKVTRISVADWDKLVRQLQVTWQSADRMLEVFGSRLDPAITMNLLEMQDAISGIISVRATFPDLLGVPDTELATLRAGSAIAKRTALEKIVTEDVKRVVASAVTLLQSLNPNPARAVR